MDDDLRAMLVALGPGGTRELAERALAHARAWSPVVDPGTPDLVGLQEAAIRLGVSRQTLGHWIAGRRGPGNFPRPLVQLSSGSVWDYRVIERWVQAV